MASGSICAEAGAAVATAIVISEAKAAIFIAYP
jgi:hypothetical protein